MIENDPAHKITDRPDASLDTSSIAFVLDCHIDGSFHSIHMTPRTKLLIGPGELGLGLVPLARRSLPVFGRPIENKV